jgi:RNA polymerase sigma factor (sigma-70 family)
MSLAALHLPVGSHRRYHPIAAMVAPQELPTIDAAFAAGHEQALKLAYDAHGGVVFGLCRRVLSNHQAEEVTQDVFVSAWRKRDQFDPARGSLAAWLVGITKRRIIDHLRSERRHSDRRADLATDVGQSGATSGTELVAANHPSNHDVEQVADKMLVAHALNSLTERPRQVIELAYLHDLTHQEIAERTGIPLGTVKSDIRRGLESIRGHLETGHE